MLNVYISGLSPDRREHWLDLLNLSLHQEQSHRKWKLHGSLHRHRESGLVLRALSEQSESLQSIVLNIFTHLAAEDLLGFNPLARKY